MTITSLTQRNRLAQLSLIDENYLDLVATMPDLVAEHIVHVICIHVHIESRLQTTVNPYPRDAIDWLQCS